MLLYARRTLFSGKEEEEGMRVLGVANYSLPSASGSFTISSPASGKNKLTEIHFSHHTNDGGESCRVGFILGNGKFTSYVKNSSTSYEFVVTVSGTAVSYTLESGSYDYVSIIVYEVEA